jgi:hypothetical protein
MEVEMKKIIYPVLGMLLLIFFVSCPTPGDDSGNGGDPTPTPTSTPTPTGTPTPTSTPTPTPGDVRIEAVLQRLDSSGVFAVQYSVVVTEDGSPCTTATVILNRPNGQVAISHAGSGVYQWSSSSSADYQPGGTYELSVNIDGNNYVDSTTARGNITITSTQVTWTSDGNSDTINITDGDAYNFTDGPDLDSPYSLPALSSGVYFITMVVTNIESGGFSGATADSMFATQDAEFQMIMIP